MTNEQTVEEESCATADRSSLASQFWEEALATRGRDVGERTFGGADFTNDPLRAEGFLSRNVVRFLWVSVK
jgi:hypothetical protein